MWYKHFFKDLVIIILVHTMKKQNSLKKNKIVGGECNETHLS